jgi:hypothetical protein
MPPTTPRSWSPSPFKRLPNRQIGVDHEFATLMALLFWIVLGVGLYFPFR